VEPGASGSARDDVPDPESSLSSSGARGEKLVFTPKVPLVTKADQKQLPL
jgi:hypothetical protein